MRKNISKSFIMIITAMTIAVGTMVPQYTVQATTLGGKIEYEDFDYVDYATRYPDLQAVYGLDKDALYKHYSETGFREGRIVKIPRTALLNEWNFDGARYAADYPDVAAVVGMDSSALLKHYKEIGYYEGRVAYATDNNTNAKLKVYDVANQITNDEMSDEAKVRVVHDWIVNNTTYGKADRNSCYSVEGPMLYGLAVCQGYAETFKAFMDVLGIDSKVIIGRAYNGQNTGGHAWNRVCLNGTWYNIDVTWDDPVSSSGNILRYNYYLISDAQISADHFASIYGNK